jgi:hypothetical protein
MPGAQEKGTCMCIHAGAFSAITNRRLILSRTLQNGKHYSFIVPQPFTLTRNIFI